MNGTRCLTKVLTSRSVTASIVSTFSQQISQLKTSSSRMPSPTKIEKIEMKKEEISGDMIKQLGKPPRMREDPAFTKVDSEEFHSIFTPELKTLVALFEKYNYELRIAGGAVRDILMKIKPKDVDLATTATPEQMKEMFTKEEVRMINAKGEKHGTITPRINNKENFEVTTLRIDVRTDGRHADVVFTTDWQLDANRRDLTINSMFLGFDGTVYDYFYGYDDLQVRRVVFVGDADVRIKEDYLRILRYFRFFGRITKNGLEHDQYTVDAITANGAGLAKISGERIWSELQKILTCDFYHDMVLEIQNCKLTQYCGLPANANIKEFVRVSGDLEQFQLPHNPILYMISLLHDLDDAIKMHERLKLSAYDRDLSLFIIQHRDRVVNEYTCLRDYQKLCLQPYAKRDFVEQLLKYGNEKRLYNQLKNWEIPVFPVNGNTLKNHGVAGKKMGIILNELRLLWVESDFKLTAEELLEKLPPILELEQQPPSDRPNKKKRTT